MAKGDYPTGALVEILRHYKSFGDDIEIYESGKAELKNLLTRLIDMEDKITRAENCLVSAVIADADEVCETTLGILTVS